MGGLTGDDRMLVMDTALVGVNYIVKAESGSEVEEPDSLQLKMCFSRPFEAGDEEKGEAHDVELVFEGILLSQSDVVNDCGKFLRISKCPRDPSQPHDSPRSGLSLTSSSASTTMCTTGVAIVVSAWFAIAFPSCPFWMRRARPGSRGPNMPLSCAAGRASFEKGTWSHLRRKEQR